MMAASHRGTSPYQCAGKIMTVNEMAAIVEPVSENPLADDVIRETRGLRKLGIPLQGRGQRGGGRVISWCYNEGYPAVLLWAYAKNESADLTTAQRKLLARITDGLLDDFRRQG